MVGWGGAVREVNSNKADGFGLCGSDSVYLSCCSAPRSSGGLGTGKAGPDGGAEVGDSFSQTCTQFDGELFLQRRVKITIK